MIPLCSGSESRSGITKKLKILYSRIIAPLIVSLKLSRYLLPTHLGIRYTCEHFFRACSQFHVRNQEVVLFRIENTFLVHHGRGGSGRCPPPPGAAICSVEHLVTWYFLELLSHLSGRQPLHSDWQYLCFVYLPWCVSCFELHSGQKLAHLCKKTLFASTLSHVWIPCFTPNPCGCEQLLVTLKKVP